MKFNERLIELRRKEGLSQEELGYKLNVTRQTVSKWELGQTTPEMDKIVAMSKIFNISADELIKESEVVSNQSPAVENQSVEKENTKNNKKTVVIIVGVVLIIVILLIIGIIKIFDTEKNNALDKFFGLVDKTTEAQQNQVSGIIDTATNVIGQVTEEQENGSNMSDEFFSVLDKVTNTMDQASGSYSQTEERTASKNFNSSIEIFNGSKKGSSVKTVLDKIISSNKAKDKKITVKYMETETQDESEIKNIKQNIGSFDDYEITFEYDADGFINKTIIKK